MNHQDQELSKTEAIFSHMNTREILVNRSGKIPTPGENHKKNKLSFKGETRKIFQQNR